MYETITVLLPELRNSKGGEMIVQKNDGGRFALPYPKYEQPITDLERALHQFFEDHPDYDCCHYRQVLEDNGIEVGNFAKQNEDISKLNGKTITIMIFAAYRAERFCDGVLLNLCKDGSLVRWIERLKEIDEC